MRDTLEKKAAWVDKMKKKKKSKFFKLPKVVGNMNPSHFFLLPTLNGSTGGPYQSCSGISCGDT